MRPSATRTGPWAGWRTGGTPGCRSRLASSGKVSGRWPKPRSTGIRSILPVQPKENAGRSTFTESPVGRCRHAPGIVFRNPHSELRTYPTQSNRIKPLLRPTTGTVSRKLVGRASSRADGARPKDSLLLKAVPPEPKLPNEPKFLGAEMSYMIPWTSCLGWFYAACWFGFVWVRLGMGTAVNPGPEAVPAGEINSGEKSLYNVANQVSFLASKSIYA